MQLNSKQLEAVETENGPVLVVAGAGAGKTKVITERIKRLIENGVPAKSILAVTFTNKAAEEMCSRIVTNKKDSIYGLQHTAYEEPFIGTFHQLGLLIIKENLKALGMGDPPTGGPTIIDEDDSLNLIKESEKDLNINPKEFDPGKFKNQISKMKNSLISVRDFEERSFWGENFKRTWERYEDKKKNQNMLDFDDLLLLPVNLLKAKEDILKIYQSRWQFIHIDEYQDTNEAQYALSKLLASAHRNIFAVGDIDQAIYSWRGADFRNVLNFQKDYAESKVITLEQNYRSTDIVLEAANSVILNNKMRLPKNLVATQQGKELIRILYGINERDEAKKIAEEMAFLRKNKVKSWNNMAVLYRTNAQSRALEEAMLTRGIPYKVIGGFKFYERKEIKDILAYLRLMQNPADNISKKRILNVPARGIGKTLALKIFSGINPHTTMQYLESSAKRNIAFGVGVKELSQSEIQKINEFENLMESLRKEIIPSQKSAYDIIQNLIKKINYREFIDDGTEKGSERWLNVQELLTITKQPVRQALRPETQHRGAQSKQTIEDFLEHVSLFSVDDKTNNTDKVVLMTAHMAKGLEFETVFIAGLEEGLFPHTLSISPEEIEEERRLFYVALTRAKNNLYITLTSQRTIFGNTNMSTPSRFIREIPEHLVVFINKPNYYEVEENIYVE